MGQTMIHDPLADRSWFNHVLRQEALRQMNSEKLFRDSFPALRDPPPAERGEEPDLGALSQMNEDWRADRIQGHPNIGLFAWLGF